MIKAKEVLDSELINIKPSSEEMSHIQGIINNFLDLIRLKLKKVSADIFIGGSFAKNTLIRKKKYDIDFFVRFDYDRYSDKSDKISDILGDILKHVIRKIDSKLKLELERIHGSRDYFGINFFHAPLKISFEIIPVLNIRHSEEAINVTDTSPLHVEYIKRNIRKNPKLADEIRLVKAFCYAMDCYGAESHIKGFSGYSLELLTCYYNSFVNLLKSAAKWNLKEKIIIDPEKFYKKEDALKKLNKAKIESPLILIDPTQKDRNATASLSPECLAHFIKSCSNFIKKPSSSYFIKKEKAIDTDGLRKFANAKKAAFLLFEVQSDKKREDIAGAKLLKFFNFLAREFNKDFSVLKSDWIFNESKKNALMSFVLKEKKEILVKGPPVKLIKFADNFKKRHKNCFVKKNYLYSKRKPRGIEDIFSLIDIKNIGIRKIDRIC